MVMLSNEDSIVLACFNQFHHKYVIMVILCNEDSSVQAFFNQFYITIVL